MGSSQDSGISHNPTIGVVSHQTRKYLEASDQASGWPLCLFWPEHFRFDVMPLWTLVKYSIFWLQALRQLPYQAIYREENGRHHAASHNGEDDHQHGLDGGGDVADLFV